MKMRKLRKELPGPESSDLRQLPQTVNLFLKKALPVFSIETCSEAFIVALGSFISFQHLDGYLWRPAMPANSRMRIALSNGVISFREELAKTVQKRYAEPSGESRDDLRITLHRSLRSIEDEPAVCRSLADGGCRAAIEIDFTYYGKPALWIILGFPSSRQFPPDETRDLLLVFSHCAQVSLHGALMAELEDREGKREKPTPAEQFDLVLKWFHTVVRHVNIGLIRLQSRHFNDAEDALRRAMIVAEVCLAELLSLIQLTKSTLPGE